MKASYNKETKIIDTLWQDESIIPKGLDVIDLPEDLVEKVSDTYHYTFKYEDGKIVEYKNTERIINGKIHELKFKLAETDYQAIKFAEGLITESDYAEVKAQRQAWRDEINELEKEL